MGLLVKGKWVDKWYDTKETKGKFVRKSSTFRAVIGSKAYPALAERYHLYISNACPWAHRTVIMRSLKGLESVISLSVVKALMLENGWEFAQGADKVNKASYLYKIYTKADPHYTGRVTVPVLWDKQTSTIVNNESAEIMRMLNSEFNKFTDVTYDYYPKEHRKEIDKINVYIYETINNGVYKVGFSTTQQAYDEAVCSLFKALDTIEKRLSTQRYLCGDQFTEADIRLFTTLIRFDPVYVGHFKCNINRIVDYPNLSNYVRDIYQISKIKETVHIDEIKTHYYGSHSMINPTGIIPEGPKINYGAPHDRRRFTQLNE